MLGADGAVTPSNRINVALIGTGRQVFYANLPWFLWSEDVQVVAVCDVDSWRMEKAKKKVEESYATKTAPAPTKAARRYRDFREVLARKDVDAVMISTPDHWHAYMAIAAAKAGKDIALEKPISLSVAEGRAIADAVKKHGRVFRTDTEVRSTQRFQQLCQVVRNGRIGQVKRVLPACPKTRRRWRRIPRRCPCRRNWTTTCGRVLRRSGPTPSSASIIRKAAWITPRQRARAGCTSATISLGMILNWGTHILDIVQWALNTERTGPVEVEGAGEFPKDNLWDVLQQLRGPLPLRQRHRGVLHQRRAARSSVSKAPKAGSRTPGSSRTASWRAIRRC